MNTRHSAAPMGQTRSEAPGEGEHSTRPRGMGRTVLVVDDEEPVRQLLSLYFTADGFEVMVAATGTEAVALHASRRPDLVILDLMLPGLDGWEVCRRIRSISRVPIIMLSARAEETDRVVGLELGADDYVAKPFSPREVVARAYAVLRRDARGGDGVTVYALPGLRLDRAAREVTAGERPLRLTRTEFELLWSLAESPGRVHTRAELVSRVWHDSPTDTEARTVDAHVKGLRRKLAACQCPCRLTTIWGIGYRLDAPEARSETIPA
jgi:two-component system, OmpR family, response regulator ResD